jgi:molybdopterin/thiamine biosynthesis adenylyltransferase
MRDESTDLPELSSEDRAIYAWQLDLPGFDETAQRRLKGARVLVSRCGGLGGPVALALAAAGVGALRIAHKGTVLPADLNRQILQRRECIGQPRRPGIEETLRGFNPDCRVEVVEAHADEANADALVAGCDLVVDAAPLFEERFALNGACVRAGIPLVEAAVHGWELSLAVLPCGQGPCLRCWVPEKPAWWTRRFPVLGAVSGTVGNLAAVQAVRLIAGLGSPLAGRLLRMDLATGTQRILRLRRDPDCPACGGAVRSPAVPAQSPPPARGRHDAPDGRVPVFTSHSGGPAAAGPTLFGSGPCAPSP